MTRGERTARTAAPARALARHGASGGARPLGLRIFKWTALALVIGLFAGVAGLGAAAWYFSAGLPDFERLEEYRPPVITRVLDASGAVIGEISTERRTVVPFAEIPDVLVKAVLAAEDAGFYSHKGLDYAGMVRAFVKNVAAGGFVQGGSTITQQVVKTFVLSPEKSLRRKAQEVLLARRLEEEFTKNDILFLYLNQIYLGHGRYGVEEAAKFYFGHGVKDVTLAEAAMLASLPKAPVSYSPLTAPDKARARRDWVLDQMVKHGFVKAAAAEEAKGVALPTSGHEPPLLGTAPEVVDAVHAELVRRYGADAVPTLGATVTTSVHADLQAAAAKALLEELRKLDKRRGFDKPRVHLVAKKAWERIAAGARDKEPLAGEHLEAVVLAVVHDAGDERMVVSLAGWLGEVRLSGDPRLDAPGMGPPSARFAPGDVVPVTVVGMTAKPYALHDLPAGAVVLGDAGAVNEVRDRLADPVRFRAIPAMGPQGALVSIDPATREIVALVGGAPYTPGGIDRATDALRPPGSSFKPLLYSAAIASRKFTAASVVSDAPSPFADGYDPDNSEPAAEGKGEMRLREALAGSINTVAVRVLERLGEPALRDLAGSAFGIPRPLHEGLSAALGTTEVTPIELCNAYAVLASAGKLGPPILVKKIEVRGKVDFEATTDVDQVLDPEVAYVVTSMMTSVVEEGTGRAARLGRPVAGKTGTTNDARNLWFGGFTPELVAVVWVGFDQPTPVKKEFGGTVAAPAWRAYMKVALEGKPASFFPRPAGIVTAAVDPKSGLLAWDGEPSTVDEVFLAGTEPTERALAPGSVTVDDWSMGGGGGGGGGAAPGTAAPESAPAPGTGHVVSSAPPALAPRP